MALPYADQPQYGAKTPVNTLKAATVTTAITDFDPALDRATQYAQRLQQLCDRVHGPQPTPVGEGEKLGEPISTIAAISLRRQRLVAILDDMERTIGALEGGI